MREGLIMAAIGIGLGAVAAHNTTQLLKSLLFGVTPQEPVTFVVAIAMFTIVALAASYIPSRRATRVDVAASLRAERAYMSSAPRRAFVLVLAVAFLAASALSDSGSTTWHTVTGRITHLDASWLMLAADPWDPTIRYRLDTETSCRTEDGEAVGPFALAIGDLVRVTVQHTAGESGLSARSIVVISSAAR